MTDPLFLLLILGLVTFAAGVVMGWILRSIESDNRRAEAEAIAALGRIGRMLKDSRPTPEQIEKAGISAMQKVREKEKRSGNG